MDEKLLFVADFLRKIESFADLCNRYGISRKTGYKWVARYEAGGLEALEERSRQRRTQNERIPHAIEQMVLTIRQSRGTPGPKKIQVKLAESLRADEIPSHTSIHNILRRADLIKPNRRCRRVRPMPGALQSTDLPNELWSADYKGQFKMCNGQWCYPLTIMDHASRYLLTCSGLTGTGFAPTKKVFEALFRECGLPNRIRTDNGVPFASRGSGNLSRLSIWWIRLGIVPERIDPGQPQQNGRHERMHRTLKHSIAQPPAANLKSQQIELTAFRNHYNECRPHESLAQRSPAECYKPSTRPYPNQLPEIEYPGWYECMNVKSCGLVYWRSHIIYVGNLLRGESVGIEAMGDGLWDVYFGPVKLGRFDERNRAKNGYLTLNV